MVFKFTKGLIHEWIPSPMDYYEVVIRTIFEGSVFSFYPSNSLPLSQGHKPFCYRDALCHVALLHHPWARKPMSNRLKPLNAYFLELFFFRYFVSGMKSDQLRFPQSARILILGCCAFFTRWLFIMIHKWVLFPIILSISRQEDDFYFPEWA